MWLLLGLGNPGPDYEETRHNVGFQVIDLVATRCRAAPLRTKLGALVGEAKLGSERVLLCKPMEYMNVSGQAVVRVAQFWKIAPAAAIVVHDDLDLPFGRLKVAAGGGHGGHNGLRSIIAEWGTADFRRVRVGVGRPPAGVDSADYVLANFKGAERKELLDFRARAAEAVEAIVVSGLTVAMNRFNNKSGSGSKTGDDA